MPLYRQTAARFRAYIGPIPVASDDPELYGKWDWATAIGKDYLLPPYLGQRTLTANLTNTTTSGFSVSGGTLPTNGGVWIGPNGVGQGWEYVTYQNNHTGFNSLKRQVSVGVNGYHDAGAPIWFWYPLDTNDGKLEYTQELSDNMATSIWTAKLGGVRAPNTILKPEHFFMVTWSTDGTDPESSWNMFLLGVIEKITMSQDASQLARWNIEISSTARLLQMSTVPNLRIGPLDIALEADAEASSTLGAAWKFALQQRQQAEFGEIEELDVIEVQSDMGPENVVDGNMDTLWVSDGWVGPKNAFENSLGVNAWASLFMYPPPTELFGSRYIEIINHDGLDITAIWVYSKYTYPGGTHAKWLQVTEYNMFADEGVGTGDTFDTEDRLILAENGEIFQRNFPSAKPKYFIDASQLSGIDAEAVRRLWWEGGAIFMSWSDTPMGDPGRGYLIHWGDCTYAELENAWETQGTDDFSFPTSNRYISIANAKPGMVLRREMQTGDDPWGFTWDWFHHPGYEISNDQNDNNFANWVKVKLPEMSHLLGYDITAGTTTIYLVDTQGIPNVEGLSLHGSGGAIIIDDEVITYNSKNYDTGTLTGCTVARPHKAGARAYARWRTPWYGEVSAYGRVFQDKVFDLATAAYPIQKLKWGRGYFKESGNDRTPFIGSFIWRFSLYEDAGTAFDGHHESDYFSEVVVDSNGWLAASGENIIVPNASINLTTAYFNPTNDGFRPRTLLLEIRKMVNNTLLEIADRPRLNYVSVEVDRRYFNPDTWVAVDINGTANSLLILNIFKLTGQWLTIFSTFHVAGDPNPRARAWGQTDRGTGWQVGTDMADYGGNFVVCDRNGRIRIGMQRYLLLADHVPTRSLTEADVTSVEIVNIRPAEVGQIRLKWENGFTRETGVVVWPETVRKGGNVVDVGPMLAGNQADAEVIAYNLYQTKRFPYNVFYELAQSDMTVQVGDIHSLAYPFYYAGEINTKILLVETVDQEFSDGFFKTVIGAREIERDYT